MDEKIKGYLMCFFGVFTWSFSEIIVKFLQGQVGPVSLSFLRFFIGGIFLLLLMAVQRDMSDLKPLVLKNAKLLIIASMIGLGVSNVIYFAGIQLTQANVGSALYTTYPIFVSIYGIFILGEKSNLKKKMIGYIIGFTGTLILMTDLQFELLIAPENILGNILLVIAAAIWSLYSVLGKKIFRSNPEISNVETKYTMVSFFLSCVPIFLILVVTPEFDGFLKYSGSEWLIILILACFSTAFGLFIFFLGVRKLEVAQGISLALLKPVMVTIFAFFILEELPTFALIIAIPLVSLAVLLINNAIKIRRETS